MTQLGIISSTDWTIYEKKKILKGAFSKVAQVTMHGSTIV